MNYDHHVEIRGLVSELKLLERRGRLIEDLLSYFENVKVTLESFGINDELVELIDPDRVVLLSNVNVDSCLESVSDTNKEVLKKLSELFKELSIKTEELVSKLIEANRLSLTELIDIQTQLRKVNTTVVDFSKVKLVGFPFNSVFKMVRASASVNFGIESIGLFILNIKLNKDTDLVFPAFNLSTEVRDLLRIEIGKTSVEIPELIKLENDSPLKESHLRALGYSSSNLNTAIESSKKILTKTNTSLEMVLKSSILANKLSNEIKRYLYSDDSNSKIAIKRIRIIQKFLGRQLFLMRASASMSIRVVNSVKKISKIVLRLAK